MVAAVFGRASDALKNNSKRILWTLRLSATSHGTANVSLEVALSRVELQRSTASTSLRTTIDAFRPRNSSSNGWGDPVVLSEASFFVIARHFREVAFSVRSLRSDSASDSASDSGVGTSWVLVT